MRFLVRSPDGTEREVELEGTTVTIGRDPSCELVIKDPKCSRRHAIVEAGSEGLSVRDNGSANGVFVNGRPVDSGPIAPGDVIRLGEVEISVLAEQMEGTLAMSPEELAALQAAAPAKPATPPAPPAAAPPAAPPKPVAPPPPPAPPKPPAPPPAPPKPAAAPPVPPPPPPPAPAPPPPVAAVPPPIETRAPESGPIPRPATLLLLTVLWAVSAVMSLFGGLGLALFLFSGPLALGTAAGGVVFAALSAAMAWGMWSLSRWTWLLQLVLAAVGILVCPFSIASLAILLYMLRPHVKVAFSGRTDFKMLSAEEAAAVVAGTREGVFSIVILAGALLGTVSGGVLLVRVAQPILQARAEATEVAVLAQVRTLVSAQAAFHGVCGAGYADEEALTNPPSTLSVGGSAFMPAGSVTTDRLGYHFELTVADRAEPTPACQRSFLRYEYLAVPLSGPGRSFLATADGTIHHAESRPATAEDPAVP
jgi:FHA domain